MKKQFQFSIKRPANFNTQEFEFSVKDQFRYSGINIIGDIIKNDNPQGEFEGDFLYYDFAAVVDDSLTLEQIKCILQEAKEAYNEDNRNEIEIRAAHHICTST